MSVTSQPAEITGTIQTLEEKLLDEEVVPLMQNRFELDQLLDQLLNQISQVTDPQTEDKKGEEVQAEKGTAARETNQGANQEAPQKASQESSQESSQEELRLRQEVNELSRRISSMSREQRSLRGVLRRQADALRYLESSAGSRRCRPNRFLMGFGLGMSVVPGVFFLFCFLFTLIQRRAMYASTTLLALLGGLGCIVLGLLLFIWAGLRGRGRSGRRNREDDWDEES